MLKLFILVFFSSLVVGVVFLLYSLAERVFQRFLTLRIKSLALKMILFLQPILILLSVVILIFGILFPKVQKTPGKILTDDSTPSFVVEIFENSKFLEAEPKVPLPDITFLITLTNYIAYIWFTVFVLLMTYKVMLYAKFKNILMKSGLHSIPFHSTKLKIYKSKSICSPFLIGFLHPFIVIPDVDMSETELSLIIKHETIHFQNRDIPLKMALEVLKCINWFHPNFYTLQKRFHYVAELVTDNIVTENLSAVQRKEYGMLLLKFAENLSYPKINMKYQGFYSYFSEEAKTLADRLEFIMKKENNKRINKFTISVMIAIAAAAIYVGISITSAAYINATEIVSNLSKKPNVPSISGKLLYDDGTVQIFDGSVDETLPSGLVDVDSHKNLNGTNLKEDKTNTTNQQMVMADLEEIRTKVLEKNEYRADATLGDSVYSLCNGTVLSAKFEQGYGNCITIQEEDGLIWKYGFCSKLAVHTGDSISIGDVIGYAGHSGFAERDSVLVRVVGE